MTTKAAPEIPALVGDIASELDFQVRQIVVEIFGRCAQCQREDGGSRTTIQ